MKQHKIFYEFNEDVFIQFRNSFSSFIDCKWSDIHIFHKKCQEEMVIVLSNMQDATFHFSDKLDFKIDLCDYINIGKNISICIPLDEILQIKREIKTSNDHSREWINLWSDKLEEIEWFFYFPFCYLDFYRSISLEIIQKTTLF